MFNSARNWLYEQFAGTPNKHWYTQINDDSAFSAADIFKSDSLAYTFEHPILTGGMLFITNLFAQAKFKLENADGSPYNGNLNSIIDLLDDPNIYQTRIDFLEAVQWMKIARGRVAIYAKRPVGLMPDSLYVLDPLRIRYPDNFKTPMVFGDNTSVGNQSVQYMETEDPRTWVTIKLRDLIWLYDQPNIISPANKLLSKSRINGLHQTLQNTVDSLVAKNIILKSNGKEMISADGEGLPMGADDEAEAKKLFNLGYGLSPTRSRGFISRANLRWQSMHIALRDLGLDESTKVDANIVFTTLHIPKDIMSLEAKKTTYNNFRESMTSFIQNGVASMVNDLTETLQIEFLKGTGIKLIGSYDHMPVMQYIRKEKFESVKLQGEALTILRNAGVPDKLALEMCGMPINTILEDVKQQQVQQQGSETKLNGKTNPKDTGKTVEEIIFELSN